MFRATDAKGEFTEGFPLGANAAAGKYTVEVNGLAEPQKVRAVADVMVASATVAPKMMNDAVRVFKTRLSPRFWPASRKL